MMNLGLSTQIPKYFVRCPFPPQLCLWVILSSSGTKKWMCQINYWNLVTQRKEEYTFCFILLLFRN
jgi:hypothetical protein